jgi:hypothetical protein
MTGRVDRRREAAPLFGVILIVIGIVFLLDELGIMLIGHLETWWPMLLVLLGVSKMAWKRRVGAGGWLVMVGLWLQAVELSLFGLTFGNSWPVFLIAVGAILIVQSLFGSVAGERGTHQNGERP